MVTVEDAEGKARCNIFSRLFYCWLEPLFCVGARRGLEHSDLYAHPSSSESKLLLDKFNWYWLLEMERKSRGKSPRIWMALLKCFWWRMLLHGCFIFAWMVLVVSESVLVGNIVQYIFEAEPDRGQTGVAYLFAMGLSLCALTLPFLHAHGFLRGYMLGMDTRVITTAAIYQKVLSLSQSTVGRLSIGHVVNLASNDVHRFHEAFVLYHYIWAVPLQLIAVTIILFYEVGYAAFIAVFLVAVQVPSQVGFARLFSILRLRAALITDSRVKVMNEVITGIRVIKMYAWEYAFKKMVDDIRKSEIWMILKASIIRAVNLGYFSLSLPFIMFIVMSVSTSTSEFLLPHQFFLALSLLSGVRFTSVQLMLRATIEITEAMVALKRIQNLLVLEELPGALTNGDNNSYHSQGCFNDSDRAHLATDHGFKRPHNLAEEDGVSLSNKPDCDIISVDRMTASWYMDHDRPVLCDVSFTLNKENPLLAVVGPVGAGKSTLLQCLLRELPAMSGSVTLRGSLAYASQESWVYSATLRENILFGLSYRAEWYNTVMEACALDKDVQLLANGDLTLVGERGITLSGGQRARVNLARAVYRNADVYLLDDPLSAVDAAVSRHIFDKCIRGLLCNHCVVLVTHQLQYVQQCDTVLVLKEGRQVRYGDPAEVLSDDTEDIMDLFGQKQDDPCGQFSIRKQRITENHAVEVVRSRAQVSTVSLVHEETEAGLEPNILLAGPPAIDTLSVTSWQTAVSHISHTATTHTHDREELPMSVEPADVAVMGQPAEERAHGSISMKTYYKYFTVHRGHLLTLLVMVVFIVGEVSIVLNDTWMSYWADCFSNNTNDSQVFVCSLTNRERILVQGGLTVIVILFSMARATLLFVLLLRSSRIYHNKMFGAVLRAPVLFFDTNPVGRVLNRFSKDVGFLDDVLPFIFCEYLLLAMRFLATIITVMFAIVYMIIVVTLLLVLLVGMRWYYIKTARDVKRLEALARSPIYSHLSTTLQGLPVIRSYSMQTAAMDQFHSAQNQHSVAWYMYLVTIRWFGVRIDLCLGIFITLVSFFTVALGPTNQSFSGLALTYVVALSGLLQFCVRQSAEVESLMVSAERVMGYSRLDPEPSLETHPDSAKPPPDWPDKGHIELSDVTYRHYPDGPLVLKGVTATILPSEKVGIVGRTGAGKSSLIATLFRLAEPNGSIKIDGMECSSLGLHDVRSKISIIPQEPVLFSGSVRYNLDPLRHFHDHDLWRVLEQVQLKDVVESLDGELDAAVSEGGTNFSVGQRQLFCLGRALLKRNHILVLDEATANVDLETDAIIQSIIREEFSEQTVLTIAHRLDTVMDSDKIMVLRSGQLIEYGDPYELLCEPNSYLRRLVEHTGPVASQKLTSMARNAHEERKNNISMNSYIMITPL